MRALLSVLALAAFASLPLSAQEQIVPTALVGLDHMPLVVHDLDAATSTWRALGFAIKDGTTHANGIRNNHVKFEDGAGIELISVSAAVDELTSVYRDLVEAAEGPAFFALHARELDKLRAALSAGGREYTEADGLVQLEADALDYLFFVQDNRSPTDRPSHFMHGNSANALVRVWVATREAKELEDMLVALGGEATRRSVLVPERSDARVVALANGELVILPQSRQTTRGRPLVGATFRVTNLGITKARLRMAGIAYTEGGAGGLSVFVPPEATHGIWLEFHE